MKMAGPLKIKRRGVITLARSQWVGVWLLSESWEGASRGQGARKKRKCERAGAIGANGERGEDSAFESGDGGDMEWVGVSGGESESEHEAKRKKELEWEGGAWPVQHEPKRYGNAKVIIVTKSDTSTHFLLCSPLWRVVYIRRRNLPIPTLFDREKFSEQ